MSQTLDMFATAEVEVIEPEPATEVRLGKRSIRYPLKKMRREALTRLREILAELEGKDIYISSYDTGGRHFWVDNLKLQKLQLEYFPTYYERGEGYIPGVIVLRGRRGAHVRIFTDYLTAIREQEYQGYWHYLLDFHNGFYDSKIDEWKSHYACLEITKFKD